MAHITVLLPTVAWNVYFIFYCHTVISRVWLTLQYGCCCRLNACRSLARSRVSKLFLHFLLLLLFQLISLLIQFCPDIVNKWTMCALVCFRILSQRERKKKTIEIHSEHFLCVHCGNCCVCLVLVVRAYVSRTWFMSTWMLECLRMVSSSTESPLFTDAAILTMENVRVQHTIT